MYLWLSDRSGSNAASNDQMFIEKTNELVVKLNETDFSYSRGWLSGFKSRCHVAKRVYEGEVARADDTAVNSGRGELIKVLKNYELEDIFDMDKTGPYH